MDQMDFHGSYRNNVNFEMRTDMITRFVEEAQM